MSPRSLAERLASIVEQIGPHLSDGTVEGAILDRTLSAHEADAQVRRALHDLLAAEAIEVVGTYEPPPVQPPAKDRVPIRATRSREDHLQVARALLVRDRGRRRLEKWILTAAEEVGLSLLIRGSSDRALEQGEFATLTGERRDAAHAMLLHNVRLVHSIARRHGGQGMDHDELVQEGVIGLVRAVELFDPHAGFKFSTYATGWVRQAISRAIADKSRVVRVPVYMHDTIRKVRAVQHRLTVDGRGPSPETLANECGLSTEKVIDCLRLSRGTLSLDATISDDGLTLGDLLDEQAHRPEHVEVKGFHPEDTWPWLFELGHKERDIVMRRFGIEPYADAQTLDEVGRDYGVTRERIRQIQVKAFKQLCALAGADELPTSA